MTMPTQNEVERASAEGGPRPPQRRRSLLRRRGQQGFSLIELIVVVTIIGILASVAVVNIINAQRKAREAALKDNLFKMRSAIDTFYADKQRYPNDLNELVPNYLKRVPKDPITNSEEWDQIIATPDTEVEMTEEEQQNQSGPGIIDVKSLAPGATLDGTPYTEL
jgi:general secretion pathway protein G